MPVDQLAKISRYVGAGGDHPPLSKLGGTRWETMKARARRAAQELAGELLNLYAERRRRRGFAFPPDSDWLRDFETAFPYRETPDQREAIEHVKWDMESERPMDRLICGDVGYGKTEVALRAAFKAANAGKQVLMLVPTTILAQQHFGTFTERLRDYPFTIEHVSRFRAPAEQRAAVKSFSEGKTDILIGTHRLLSRDVRAKDLGLLIVDEEQRFGVKQKDLLRQLRLKVDVISMSATPIPRTLQMSLAGMRDISVIETPPEGRRPVKTYVGEYDEALVKQALEREKAREGQAFFLHNRIEDIDETAERLRALCPGMSFTVAHGQMDEKLLEERMFEFLRGDADVLVSTSIIESGIDIPQANTLIVERSDIFGLSQLYQIRGRVGRSRERAYAYLLYPSAGALTEEAANRLSALSDYTELGSGFKIAMRDLELRGAGNLLGDEQSGHVAALGFELYMQMLDEAVRAMGDGAVDEEDLPEPVRLDVNVDAYIPADYIPYEQAKVEVHRRIAGAREVSELVELRVELSDRFGDPPEPLENLITLQQARIKLGQAGARAVTFRQGRLAVTPIELDSVRAKQLRAEIPGILYESGKSQLSMRVPDDPAEQFPAVVRAADALLALSVALRIDPLPSIRVMTKTKLCTLALGAFFVPAILVAGCGGVPGNAVAEVDGTAIEKNDFEHWLTVAAKSGGQATAAAPKPPDYAACINAEAQDHAEARQGPAEGHRQPAQDAVQAGVRRAARPGAAAADLLRVDRGRGRAAEHQGHGRRGQEVLRQAEEGGVPQGRRLRQVPQGVGPDRGGHPPARPPRHPLQQDPREGDQGQGQGHRRPDRGVLQQEQGPLRAARAA